MLILITILILESVGTIRDFYKIYYPEFLVLAILFYYLTKHLLNDFIVFSLNIGQKTSKEINDMLPNFYSFVCNFTKTGHLYCKVKFFEKPLF
uniref:Uncharacterized protein n=1 Tax=Gloeochaete wittrockiana TaxID=38269 RepID=A0A096Y6Q5_9EUKA|nr:hypothetical protein [Gloeochaete wittrockiana]AIM52011.1 hypothetical protein [Gloeochaete wittrockiana]